MNFNAMSFLRNDDAFPIPVRRFNTMPASFQSNFGNPPWPISLPICPRPQVTSITVKNYLPETIKHIFEKINDTKANQTNSELPKFSEEYKKIEEQITIRKELNENVFTENHQKSQNINAESILEQPKEIKRKKIMKHSLSINEIIKIVCKWRKMCYPERINPGSIIKSKEEAARHVSIKKKSLDDYLMFIRLGITMGFDFQFNGEKTFNFLRKYIKSIKNRIHWNKNFHPDVESLLGNLP